MNIIFTLQSVTDGSFLTGQAANTTVYISKDGESYAATTNAVVEIGRGSYKVTLTSAEATFNDELLYQPVCTGAQTNTWAIDKKVSAEDNANAVWGAQNKEITGTVTINSTQAGTFATSADLTTVGNNVSAIKAKTDNLPAEPAAVGSAMTLTSETVTSIKSGLATGDNIEAALGALEMYGDVNWLTADLSDVSTFDPSTDAVTLTDAYDAAKTASQLTTSDLSMLATSAELTAASASLTTLINLLLSGLYHWQVNDTIMTVYNASDVAIGAYTLTKDTTGNITAVTPIVQQQDTNNEG